MSHNSPLLRNVKGFIPPLQASYVKRNFNCPLEEKEKVNFAQVIQATVVTSKSYPVQS